MVSPGYCWANPAQSIELALRVAAAGAEGAVLAANCPFVAPVRPVYCGKRLLSVFPYIIIILDLIRTLRPAARPHGHIVAHCAHIRPVSPRACRSCA
jgi:hypothetical protein